MTNTDRLAQALREKIVRDVAELPDRTSSNEWPDMMLVSAQELGDIVTAALASLATAAEVPCASCTSPRACEYHGCKGATAAVEGEFLNIANDCRAVAGMKMLRVSTRSRLLLAAEIVEKSSAQVAALTAQCATAGNYVCDKEVCPTSVRFTDGRVVRLAHDADHGYYLEIERES